MTVAVLTVGPFQGFRRLYQRNCRNTKVEPDTPTRQIRTCSVMTFVGRSRSKFSPSRLSDRATRSQSRLMRCTWFHRPKCSTKGHSMRQQGRQAKVGQNPHGRTAKDEIADTRMSKAAHRQKLRTRVKG